MKYQLGVRLFVLSNSILFINVRAQTSQNAYSQDDAVSNFQPSLAVVIGILGVMFSVTFVLLMFAKLCNRNNRISRPLHQNQHPATLLRSRSRFSGIDKTAIESLPFFRFSSLRGSKDGLECAVCLSKFEDVEILRLLPKCKHAFHIDCIDHWLEKHSTCPICRHKVTPEDHTIFTYSNSSRMQLANQSGLGEDQSNIEIFVQREQQQEQNHSSSSRFSIGGSFRKIGFGKDVKEEELPIQKGEEERSDDSYHKHNHRITISDVVFKHRWSNVSSSDLMFLNSEILHAQSSNRFNNLESNAIENEQIINIKEEMERKISFESKFGAGNKHKSISDKDPLFTSDSARSFGHHHAHKYVNHGENRSVSEITAVSRFGNSSLPENNHKEERMRQLWFPIARRTAEWFVNRERRSQQSQNKEQPLDV